MLWLFPCLPSSWNRGLALLAREGDTAVLSFCLGKEGRVPAASPSTAAPPFHSPCAGVRLQTLLAAVGQKALDPGCGASVCDGSRAPHRLPAAG